jgi:hypothetical protein
MRILRAIAFLLLFAAIAVGAADYVEHTNNGGTMFRTALDWWMTIAPASLDWFQGVVEAGLGPDFWDPMLTTILSWPAVLVLVMMSMAIFLIVGFLRSF